MKTFSNFKKFCFCVSTLISTFALLDSKVQAQQSCASLAGVLNPPIGTACVERVYIKTGHADWPDERRNQTEEYAPPNRYWIISYVSPLTENSAQQSSASRQIVAGGQVSNPQREIDDLYRSALDSYNKLNAEATIPIKGVPVNLKGVLENVERRVNEIHNSQRYISNVSSNVSQVILRAEAWGECKWRIPFSSRCGDGTGGWYDGYVDVTRIYVGDVAALERQLASEVEAAFQSVRQVVGRQVYFSNQCQFPIRLALRYGDPSGQWVTNGWWSIEANKSTFLSSSNEAGRIRSNNSTFYYYAEITQDPHPNYSWNGDQEIEFQGQMLRMRQTTLSPNSDGNYVLTISCSNL